MKKTKITPVMIILILLSATLYGLWPARLSEKETGSLEVIALDSRQDLRTLSQNFPLDPLLADGLKVYFLVERQYLRSIQESGYVFTIETGLFHQRGEKSLRLQAEGAGGLNGAYHSYREMAAELKSLAASYPTLARLYVPGQSLENRNIYALKISDNPGLNEDEPGIALLGGHHAREWISVEVPLLIGRYLLENYSREDRVRALVNSAEVWIVPLVNPDGLEYSILNYRLWRKNRRLNQDGSYGVDLNRNYSYEWAHDDIGSSPEPSSAVFRGTGPFSEPETEAIRKLFQNQRISAAISYHSFSQLILYPWGYLDQPTEDEALLQSLAQEMAGLISQVNGRVYQTGRAAASLYLTNGDFADWAYGLFRIPAFTIELPPVDLVQGGFLNSESDIEPIFRENLPAALYLIEWAIDSYVSTGARAFPLLRRKLEKNHEIMIKDRPGAAFKGKESR
ncbi:MAG: Carboxypeptidase T [Candidatus Saccharicenans subterraneus]|uniref:carboxypeptidase T n=1 Tax=Candidatus Saccharicenans subterraneus TaxID=2508984 RepID=A0A3E2BP34_9BACT|nr:MAG: Carboxypeptidase T [Candidatus Saccharicenans subterraneum]